nr:PREDICTED: protein FAM163A [Pelecanus crispus]
MTAGTVVITGGILATVILLCIIAVLCYCRLQDGAHNYCPTCSPYGSPFYIRTADMVRNGGERVTYAPACYKEMGPPINMATLQSYPVSRHGLLRESFPNPRAISTEV